MSKFCGKCGAKLEDDAVFCGTCGSSVGEGGNTTVNTTIINNVYNGHTISCYMWNIWLVLDGFYK